jgi:hypothetical protein
MNPSCSTGAATMNELSSENAFFDVYQLKRLVEVETLRSMRPRSQASQSVKKTPVRSDTSKAPDTISKTLASFFANLNPFRSQLEDEPPLTPGDVDNKGKQYDPQSAASLQQSSTPGDRTQQKQASKKHRKADTSSMGPLLPEEPEFMSLQDEFEGAMHEVDTLFSDNGSSQEDESEEAVESDTDPLDSADVVNIEEVISGGDLHNTVLVVRFSTNDLLLMWQDNMDDIEASVDELRHRSMGTARSLSWFRERNINIRGGMDISPDGRHLLVTSLQGQIYVVPLASNLFPNEDVITFGATETSSLISKAISVFGARKRMIVSGTDRCGSPMSVGSSSSLASLATSAPSPRSADSSKSPCLHKSHATKVPIAAQSSDALKCSLYELLVTDPLVKTDVVSQIQYSPSLSFATTASTQQSSASVSSQHQAHRFGLCAAAAMSPYGANIVSPSASQETQSAKDAGQPANVVMPPPSSSTAFEGKTVDRESESVTSSSTFSFSIFGSLPFTAGSNVVTSCVWWRSVVTNADYAIYSTTIGTLVVVDLRTQKEVAVVPHSQFQSSRLSKIEVVSIPASQEAYLLVHGLNGKFWQVYLELADPSVPPHATVLGPRRTKFLSIAENSSFTIAPLAGAVTSRTSAAFKPHLLSRFSNVRGCSLVVLRSFRDDTMPMVAVYHPFSLRCEIFDALSIHEQYPMFVFHVPQDTWCLFPTSKLLFAVHRSYNGDVRAGERISVLSSLFAAMQPQGPTPAVQAHAGSSPSAVDRVPIASSSPPVPSFINPIVVPTVGQSPRLAVKSTSAVLQEMRLPAKESFLGFIPHPRFADVVFCYTQTAVYQLSLHQSPADIFLRLLANSSVEVGIAEKFAKTFGLDMLALYEKAADQAFERADYERSLQFYSLSNCVVSKVVHKFTNVLLETDAAEHGTVKKRLPNDIVVRILQEAMVKLEFSPVGEQRVTSDLFFYAILQYALETKQTDRLERFLRDNKHYNAGNAIFHLVTSGYTHLALVCAHYRDPSLVESVCNLLINRGMFSALEHAETVRFIVEHKYAHVVSLTSGGILLYMMRDLHYRFVLMVADPQSLALYEPLMIQEIDHVELRTLLHITEHVPLCNLHFVALIAIIHASGQSDVVLPRGTTRMDYIRRFERDFRKMLKAANSSGPVLSSAADKVKTSTTSPTVVGRGAVSRTSVNVDKVMPAEIDVDLLLKHAVHYTEWQVAQEILKTSGRLAQSLALRLNRSRTSAAGDAAVLLFSILEDLEVCLRSDVSDSGIDDQQAAMLIVEVFTLAQKLASSGDDGAATANEHVQRFVTFVQSRMEIFAAAFIYLIHLDNDASATAFGKYLPALFFTAVQVYAEMRSRVVSANTAVADTLRRQITENLVKRIRKREAIRVPLSVVKQAGKARVFSCGHSFAEQQYFDQIIPTFKDKCASNGLNRECPQTVTACLREFSKQTCHCACPVCVFNYLLRRLCDRDTHRRFDRWLL